MLYALLFPSRVELQGLRLFVMISYALYNCMQIDLWNCSDLVT